MDTEDESYRKPIDKHADSKYNDKRYTQGEIKPFAYGIRKFIFEKVLKMEAQKRLSGKGRPDEFDEDPSSINKEVEQVLLAAYQSVALSDDERLVLIESYCKNCKNKTVKIISNKTRRLICTGCGREISKL